MKRFGSLPLLHQPGEKWMYHSGSDILGVLIARSTGQKLGAFFHERIFAPLGMKDTGFSVPEAKLDRLATCYQTSPGTGRLVSTVDDFLAFGRMMLNMGMYGRERRMRCPGSECNASSGSSAGPAPAPASASVASMTVSLIDVLSGVD